MSRGIHTAPNTGNTVDWCTPPDLLHSLGDFDHDPCASQIQVSQLRGDNPWGAYADTLWHDSVGPFLDTTHGRHGGQRLRLGDTDHWRDGLAYPWCGRVWLNPPHGKTQHLWMRKLAEHGVGTALVASRTEVEKWWVPYVWQAATAVLFLTGRLHYWTPAGERADGNAGHGSALIAYGRMDAALLLLSEIEGQFVWLGHHGRSTGPTSHGV